MQPKVSQCVETWSFVCVWWTFSTILPDVNLNQDLKLLLSITGLKEKNHIYIWSVFVFLLLNFLILYCVFLFLHCLSTAAWTLCMDPPWVSDWFWIQAKPNQPVYTIYFGLVCVCWCLMMLPSLLCWRLLDLKLISSDPHSPAWTSHVSVALLLDGRRRKV